MNQNVNMVKLPKGAQFKGKEVLKVLSRTISDKEGENGYMVVNEDGDRVFMKDRDVMNLTEKSSKDAPAAEEKE